MSRTQLYHAFARTPERDRLIIEHIIPYYSFDHKDPKAANFEWQGIRKWAQERGYTMKELRKAQKIALMLSKERA